MPFVPLIERDFPIMPIRGHKPEFHLWWGRWNLDLAYNTVIAGNAERRAQIIAGWQLAQVSCHTLVAQKLAHSSECTSRDTRRQHGYQSRDAVETFLPHEDRWYLLATPTEEVRLMLPKNYRALAMDGLN
jgi:hypothetical protein